MLTYVPFCRPVLLPAKLRRPLSLLVVVEPAAAAAADQGAAAASAADVDGRVDDGPSAGGGTQGMVGGIGGEGVKTTGI